MTEINFGLHSAGSERLMRHDRSRQGSTYLRTAIQPSTPNLQRSTFNVQPSTPNLQPSTFNAQPSTLQRSTFNVQRATFNVHRSPARQRTTHNVPTFNVQPSPPNLQPSTFNVQPSTFNLQPSTFNLHPPRLTVISRSRRARAAPLSRLWRAWCSPSRRSAARSAATRAAAAFNSATSRRAL